MESGEQVGREFERIREPVEEDGLQALVAFEALQLRDLFGKGRVRCHL